MTKRLIAAILAVLFAAPALPATAQGLNGAGRLLSQQLEPGAPDGATAYRVIYRSTGLKSEPIEVSGMVIVPAGAAADAPIIAWAHPTTGVDEQCGPSLASSRFQQIEGLNDMLDRGYIVTATDYPGLGTPGIHPYLVGASEGRAVLDSVRAAENLTNDQGAPFAVWGHSQGGQAALYAGLLARTYAPDLRLAGVAAAAPATELGPLMQDDLPTIGGKNLLAMTLWSWSQVYGIPLDDVVDPAALPAVNRLAAGCLESIADLPGRILDSRTLQRRFLSVENLASIEPWKTLLAENTIGTLPPSLPVFIAQGTADDTVDPAITLNYAKTLCAAGSDVTLLIMPRVGHAMAARKSADAAVNWIAARFAGAESTSNCGQI